MSTGAMLCRPHNSWRLSQPCVVDSSNVDMSNVLPAEALFYRQKQCVVDKSMFRSTGAALSTGAWFARHEHASVNRSCFIDRSTPGSYSSSQGGLGAPSGQPARPGRPVWATGAAWESVWAAWGPFDVATKRCLFCRQEHWEACLGCLGGLGICLGGLGGSSGLFGRPRWGL